MPSGSVWTDSSGNTYRLIHKQYDAYSVCIGIQEKFFSQQKYNAALILSGSIGFALVLGMIFTIAVTYYNSRPMERILTLLRSYNKQPAKFHWKEIENSLSDMAYEINRCKQTIQELDKAVSQELLEKFYQGRLTPSQLKSSFFQYFPPLPSQYYIAVFYSPGKNSGTLAQELPQLLNSPNRKSIYLRMYQDRIYTILNSSTVSIEALETYVTSLVAAKNTILKAGVSEIINSPDAVPQASRQAVERLEYGLNLANEYIIARTESPAVPHTFIQIHEMENLQRALLQGNDKISFRLVEELFQKAQTMHFDRTDLRQLFFSLRTVYSGVLLQMIRQGEAMGVETDWVQPFPNDLDEYGLEAVKNTCFTMNSQLLELSRFLEKQSSKMRAVNLIRYIEENYNDPDLCASSLGKGCTQ